jgi:hypothetical protein
MFLHTAVCCTSSSFLLVPLCFHLPALNIIILLIRFLFSLIDVSCRRRSIFVAVAAAAVVVIYLFISFGFVVLSIYCCLLSNVSFSFDDG